MTKTIEAVFDGSVLHPQEPLTIEPNTRVRVTVETLPDAASSVSFLQVARNLGIKGPADWSSRIEDYLEDEPGNMSG